MIRNNQYVYLDHDFVETSDGWIFGVVSNVHPPGRILSYLKYLPGDGVWTRGAVRYRRVLASYSMREISQMLETVRRVRPEFIYRDPFIDDEFIYVPVEKVWKHHRCEEGLQNMMNKPRHRFEQTCVELVKKLAYESNVVDTFFGISGSLLLKLYNPVADIDLVVYGGTNFRKVVQASMALQTREDRAATISTLTKNYMAKYPITEQEATKLAERCHTRGFFEGIPYSIHAVKTLAENTKQYGSVASKFAGTARKTLKIIDSTEGVFTPASYDVEDLDEGVVKKLVCYDTTFAGLFKEGDIVEAYGKLEQTRDFVENRVYMTLLIGSVKTAGMEYVKLLETA
ncbi:MAG: hypothetical protein QXG52_07770 [Candidatus Caldarchaeum sp.]